MKKLKLDFHQLDALTKMLDLSCNHYANEVRCAKTLFDMCNDQLHYEILSTIYMQCFKFVKAAEKHRPHLHLIEIQLTPTQALVFVASIIPENNLTYYGRVKQIVIDYCIDLLKEMDVLPKNPTYRPTEKLSPAVKPLFHNSSTNINDYINE